MIDKNIGLTYFSEIVARRYRLEEACKYMTTDFPLRNSSDELKKLLEKKDIDEKSFIKLLGRRNAAKAGKWLNGDTKIIKRESVVEILLALRISDVTEAEDFLMHSCGHDGFYARNYKDIIYIFCLENCNSVDEDGNTLYDIEKMKELIEKYKYLDNLNADVEITNDSTYKLIEEEGSLTRVLFNSLENIVTELDLDEFFIENKDYFGSFNRTAYKKFMEYYNKYINSEYYIKLDEEMMQQRENGDIEPYARDRITIEEICKSVSVSNPSKREGLNLIQKIIDEDDPTRTRLGSIIRKDENVPRKYLILFFLTWRGDSVSPQSSIIALNKLLDVCGMPRLDSRNPFDWVVMNSLYATAKSDFGTLYRMKKMVKKVFDIETEEI